MSQENIDNVRILELMASKICHDLISPVGAISNGLEILEELGSDANNDIIDLIAFSSNQASAKLKAMRLAYGTGGSDSSIKSEDVHKIFGDFISGENRISQDWDPHADLGIEPQEGFSKILMLSLLFIVDTLPKGGVVSVKSGGLNSTIICGEGENAHLRDGYLHALEHKIQSSELDPKLVHAYITGLLAQNYDFEITIDETENNFISLRLKSTPVSL